MTEKWEGFTQEEILCISNEQKNPSSLVKELSQSSLPVMKVPFKFGKKNMTRERMLKTSNRHRLGTEKGVGSLPQGARLFIPQIPEEDEIEDTTVCETKPVDTNSSPPVPPELSNDSKPDSSDLKNLPPVLLSAPSETSLEEFEKRQNLIKEQNRQKKELLKRAIEDRTKRTHEEARRLGQIEEELKKLDVKLSTDVSILRNQIEVASLEFMEAQKRFDRAEKEYLEAKMSLFARREHKELLTSHLCTIIEQNELRKARQLSDLMHKLDLGSVVIEKPFVKPLEQNNAKSSEPTAGNPTPTARNPIPTTGNLTPTMENPTTTANPSNSSTEVQHPS